MEIRFEKEPVVKLDMDVKVFKEKFKETLDLKNSFYYSTKVKEMSDEYEHDEETVKSLAFFNMNWSKIIGHLHELADDTKEIQLTICHVDGMCSYSPGVFNTEERVMRFKEKRLKAQDVFLTHGLIPLTAHHIETFMANAVFDYVDKKWEREVDAKEGP